MGSTGIFILLLDRRTTDTFTPRGGRLHRRRTAYGQIGLGRLLADGLETAPAVGGCDQASVSE